MSARERLRRITPRAWKNIVVFEGLVLGLLCITIYLSRR